MTGVIGQLDNNQGGQNFREQGGNGTPDVHTQGSARSCSATGSAAFELRRRNGFIEARSNSKTQAIEQAKLTARRVGYPIVVVDTTDDDRVIFRALPDAQAEHSKRGHNPNNDGTSRPTRPIGLDLEEDDEQAIADLSASLAARMQAEHEAQRAKAAQEAGYDTESVIA